MRIFVSIFSILKNWSSLLDVHRLIHSFSEFWQALGTNPLRSIKKGQGDKNIPVFFGNVHFKPGNFIYADEDGIVVSSVDIHAKLWKTL